MAAGYEDISVQLFYPELRNERDVGVLSHTVTVINHQERMHSGDAFHLISGGALPSFLPLAAPACRSIHITQFDGNPAARSRKRRHNIPTAELFHTNAGWLGTLLVGLGRSVGLARSDHTRRSFKA